MMIRMLVGLTTVCTIVACGSATDTPDGGASGVLVCDTGATAVAAAKLQTDVIDVACKSCHNPTGTARLSGDYSTASTFVAATVNKASAYPSTGAKGFKIVTPNDLAASVLWLKVSGGQPSFKGPNGEFVGGVMPETGPITAAQKKLIKDWICTGAK